MTKRKSIPILIKESTLSRYLGKRWKYQWNVATKARDMPRVNGVYVVYEAFEKKVVYVGQGILQERVRSWFNTGKIACYVKWRVARRLGEHLMAEYRLINRLQPKLNEKGIYKQRQKDLPLQIAKDKLDELLMRKKLKLGGQTKDGVDAIVEAVKYNEIHSQQWRERMKEWESAQTAAAEEDDLPSPPGLRG